MHVNSIFLCFMFQMWAVRITSIPFLRVYKPIWTAVGVYCGALVISCEPYEHIVQIFLRFISLKKAFLLALTLTKQVSHLCLVEGRAGPELNGKSSLTPPPCFRVNDW